jgi:hypothetical protein
MREKEREKENKRDRVRDTWHNLSGWEKMG